MFDLIYKKRLRDDVETWVEKGWLTSDGAANILASTAAEDGRSKVPMVLGGIGVLCIALALAAFIAANWGAIPRNVKLIGIIACVLGSHGLAAWSAASGRKGLADLATAFATLVFVGALALVGQIFHLPTNWPGGAFLVCLGALAAAWIAGSRTSLIVAAVAAISWQIGRSDIGAPPLLESLIGLVLLLAILAHPVVHPNRLCRWAATSLLLITFGRWLADTGEALQAGDSILFAMAVAGFAGLAASLVQLGQIGELLVKWSDYYPQRSHGRWLLASCLQDVGVALLCGLLVFVLLFHSEFGNAPLWSPLTTAPVALTVGLAIAMNAAGFLLSFKTGKSRVLFAAILLALLAALIPVISSNIVLVAALNLAALVAISLMGTLHNNSFWTLCGYAGLTAAVLWLLDVTVGSLLGQSVFFLIAGVVLLGLAFAVTRMLRRRAPQQATAQEARS